ncbi:Hypothetical protein GL50581_4370 [Giardia duodenalis ATCC 50581]|nr:Hypothetical protein GL50581_4370 [Giardia intestinalis ATCC 50581]
MSVVISGKITGVSADFCEACSHTAVHIHNGMLYCFGGGKKGSNYLFRVSEKLSVSSRRPMPCLPRTLNATCIANNRLYSLGGCESMLNIHDGLISGDVLSIINLADNSYCEVYLIGVKVPGLVGATLLPLDSTNILLCGGADSAGQASSVFYLINTAKYQTSTYCEFPAPGIGTSFTLVDGVIYAFGGQTPGGLLSTLYTMPISESKKERQWTSHRVPSKVPRRYCHSACGHEGYLAIFGGRTETRILNDMWIYTPQSDEWRKVVCPSSLGGRYSAPMCSLKEGLLVAGGIGSLAIYGAPFIVEPLYSLTKSPVKQVALI